MSGCILNDIENVISYLVLVFEHGQWDQCLDEVVNTIDMNPGIDSVG